MKTSWLMVTIHSNNNETRSLHEWDMIRRVEAIGTKATRLGNQYELELNNGKTMEQIIAEHKATGNDYKFYSVCAIPFSQARDYRNFETWEECEMYDPNNTLRSK